MRRYRLVAGLLFVLMISILTANLSFAQDNPQTTEEAALPPAEPVVATIPPTVESVPLDAAQPAVQPASSDFYYTVRYGDNLFRIALRFNTSVSAIAQANGITNTSLIFAGQQLRIPGVTAPTPTPAVPPSPTAVPIPTTTHVVQRGDTLFKIAVRYNTTVSQLVSMNNLRNPNIIYVGQVLTVPNITGVSVPTVAQDTPPTATADTAAQAVPPTTEDMSAQAVPTEDMSVIVPTQEIVQGGGAVAPGFGYARGIEAFMVDQDVTALTDQILSLGVTWVKQEILWRDFEPVRGQIDFDTLDEIVNELRAANLNVLLTVSAAPAWARASTDENGPPDNFADYGYFIGALASRYVGQVQAYEIWNEPNLRREWNSSIHNISAASYIELLRTGYNAVKAADPNALVISAGLAPTGFNDGVNAINDRQFLNALYVSGLAGVSDAVGAHPLGWANPPDALCCEPPVGVETHYQDPSFFFLETLRAYRDTMVANNDGSTPIWVTKFGWGTSEDTDPPSEIHIFVSYTSLGEQAIYVPRGFELGEELGYVGPMFLDNLNGCQVLGSAENCYYAVIGPDGAPRPVFAAVQQLNSGVSTTAPLPTPEPIIEMPTAEGQDVLPPDVIAPTAEGVVPEPLPTDAPLPTTDPGVPTVESFPLMPEATQETAG
jgi:LysM repeat protein